MNLYKRVLVPAVLLVVLITAAGCKKKSQPLPPMAAPPVAAAPTARIVASPTAVLPGDSVLLSWSTTGATSASIEGLGTVPVSGSKSVIPTASTSYRLVASGLGGTAEATVYVTVNRPQPVEKPMVKTLSSEEEFRANVKDVFFGYDSYSLTDEAKSTVLLDASFLLAHADEKILIAGYCDERGSAEYNISLGQNRANAAKKALVNAGVPEARIRVVSYGKEKPFCTASTEACWQTNRRAAFTIDR